MDMGQDDGTFEHIKNALRSGAWVGQVPWLYWLHDFLMPVIGNHLGINIRHGRMRDFAVREIQNRKDRGSDHQDILARLFEVQKEKPEMDDLAVTSMATSNIFAGSDTTAVSIRAILYYLLKNPEYKMRLVEEIDERRKQGKLSDVAKLEEAKEMPYLQAVMYEALRMHPAVGMSLPRVTPHGGIKIDGHFIPEGVRSSILNVFKCLEELTLIRPSSGRILGLSIATQRSSAKMRPLLDPIDG
jgi:cytochrome P450